MSSTKSTMTVTVAKVSLAMLAGAGFAYLIHHSMKYDKKNKAVKESNMEYYYDDVGGMDEEEEEYLAAPNDDWAERPPEMDFVNKPTLGARVGSRLGAFPLPGRRIYAHDLPNSNPYNFKHPSTKFQRPAPPAPAPTPPAPAPVVVPPLVPTPTPPVIIVPPTPAPTPAPAPAPAVVVPPPPGPVVAPDFVPAPKIVAPAPAPAPKIVAPAPAPAPAPALMVKQAPETPLIDSRYGNIIMPR